MGNFCCNRLSKTLQLHEVVTCGEMMGLSSQRCLLLGFPFPLWTGDTPDMVANFLTLPHFLLLRSNSRQRAERQRVLPQNLQVANSPNRWHHKGVKNEFCICVSTWIGIAVPPCNCLLVVNCILLSPVKRH
jgi:hypothetical protein